MKLLCSKTLLALDQPACELSVVFIGAAGMRLLNRKYRGRDSATDVLSFAYHGESAEGLDLLGEVVVAPEVAALNARRWNTTPDMEIRRLLIHGLLHVLGHDHETDAGEMERLQRRLVHRRFFLNAERVLLGK